MRDDPSVIDLVARVTEGDQEAWHEVVERYAPLVWSICVRYQLDRRDIDDVGQSVWLALVEHIASLREPAALPGWLATTTRNECLRVLRAARRQAVDSVPAEDLMLPDTALPIEQEIIEAERHAALRAAMAELSPACHELLALLISDPSPGYAEISTRLGMPVGSIGPTRARCLDRLRRSPRLAAVLADEAGDVAVKLARR